MYVCICNPFTDEDVQQHLDERCCKSTVEDTYTACSGGESMNCCSCMPAIKKMVDTHNNKLTIEALSDQMEQITQHTKETV
ncbi:MAG: (2Fe-2S)-binding protein [Alcanivorax sp.]